jgi:hypothetical protein
MLRIVFAIIVLLHACIHLIGFANAFHLGTLSHLKQPISRPVGVIWLLTFILFLFAGTLLMMRVQYWWPFAAAAVCCSQYVIILSWNSAKWGTLANLLIVVPLVVTLIGMEPSGYKPRYNAAVNSELKHSYLISLLQESDLAHLPMPVQRYLRYTGALGKPKVNNCRVLLRGRMKNKPDGQWLTITAKQFDFFDSVSRFFYIESAMYGLPFEGLHVYRYGKATMQIKAASLWQVANAYGQKMNQSETVTLFNDMCLLAPASLISRRIEWETIDSVTVKATFTNGGNVVSALLYFNRAGALINFVSDDRYLSADGKSYINYRWSTPVKDYHEIDGRTIWTYGEAIWQTGEGPFVYAQFTLEQLDYNCSTVRSD